MCVDRVRDSIPGKIWLNPEQDDAVPVEDKSIDGSKTKALFIASSCVQKRDLRTYSSSYTLQSHHDTVRRRLWAAFCGGGGGYIMTLQIYNNDLFLHFCKTWHP